MRRCGPVNSRARVTKIALHGQLADLRVQVVDDRLMVALAVVGAAGEHLLQTILGLPLPAGNPARMHLVLGRDLWIVRSPRSASIATRALNSAVNRRLFVAISLALLLARILP